MNEISIVLNVYKRPYMLEEQIQAIKNQSIPISNENIHVWYNKSDAIQNDPIYKIIKTYRCNWNTKFWGRFMIPLILTTQYIALFDDDIIPQKDWLANCINTINKPETNGILGGAGIVLNGMGYMPHQKIGWNGKHFDHAERVDLVGHAWFFRQEWCKYLWYETPPMWNNGEDIMFSYLSQKHGGINTFVPPHPESERNMWCTDYETGMRVGCDENSSWKMGSHYEERDRICRYCISNGWNTVKNIS